MTDKELKRLGRAELIDIIYELQIQREQQETELQTLRRQLDDKLLQIEQSGSIAEAAIRVNQVIEAAQAAADQYLGSIHAANADLEQRVAEAEAKAKATVEAANRQAEGIVSQAQQKADATLREAETRAEAMLADAQRQADARWDSFQRKAAELLRAQEDLRNLVKRN